MAERSNSPKFERPEVVLTDIDDEGQDQHLPPPGPSTRSQSKRKTAWYSYTFNMSDTELKAQLEELIAKNRILDSQLKAQSEPKPGTSYEQANNNSQSTHFIQRTDFFFYCSSIATKTSQPFHVALAIAVLVFWLSSPGSDSSLRGWRALYVGAVATHLGAQVWMTLVSGIVLYFSLPRHEFGRVQTVLFPTYYAFNAGISMLALLSYFRMQCLTKFAYTSYAQFALLLAVFSIEAYVRLRLVSPMLRAKHIKTQMEEVAGGGQEVGRLILGELAHCPRYLRVLRTFRMYHSSIAMGTMIALGCSVYSTMIIVDAMCH
ncbi:uncharacterized protein LOC114360193 [Ostrinia furnacalis]|uniref:uncharacterized protein LOC114360193 n=1 Tax=Ostrinia furnacalis TaxID=93504 RepID=UPI00103FB177|nr:uncharacterized protein LOC114360193 [Ostrinia furnacalis]